MKIHKYPINDPVIQGQVVVQSINMHKGAKILHCTEQNGDPTLWVMEDPKQEREERIFTVVPTGGDVPESEDYVGTVRIDWMVFHVFERMWRL